MKPKEQRIGKWNSKNNNNSNNNNNNNWILTSMTFEKKEKTRTKQNKFQIKIKQITWEAGRIMQI